MSRVYVSALFAFVVVWQAGCVKHYQAPKPNEPHAIVKVRRAYHSHAGSTLSETANIGEFQVMAQSRAADLDDTQTTAVRVHPGNALWRLQSTFSHMESHQVQETYTVQEPYSATETYNCGSYSSTGSSYQTCTRSATHYRSVTKTRMVTRNVSVIDAACLQVVAHLAEVGHTYLLQYSYTGNEVCSLVCLEQVALAAGGFDTRPCPPPTRDTASH